MTELLVIWLSGLAFDVGRYVFVVLPAFFGVWVWGRERFRPRLVQGDYAGRQHLHRELVYSASTVLVFSVVGIAVFVGKRAGLLQIDDGTGARGWAYFAFTLVALAVLHDAYFYWTHRAMHHRLLFKRVHAIHHRSTNPSPLAAYAFAPPEALIQALYVPLVALVLPVSEIALFLFLLFMIVRNVLGHLGVELHPPGFVRGRWTRMWTTTTHHALHHKKPGGNYGLYFTFWDRAMATTHPDYESVFDAVTSRPIAPEITLTGQLERHRR